MFLAYGPAAKSLNIGTSLLEFIVKKTFNSEYEIAVTTFVNFCLTLEDQNAPNVSSPFLSTKKSPPL